MLASHEPTTNRRSSATSAATSTLLNFCLGMVRVGVKKRLTLTPARGVLRARSPRRRRSTPEPRVDVCEISAAAVSRLALESDAVGVCVKPRPREHRRPRVLRTARAVSSSALSEATGETYLETASRPSRFEESSWGDPEAVEVLLQAMRIQWSHGYPDTPRGYDRLTHGFHEYPAGMQAAAADRCLDCLPGTTLLDPFCGGGTSVVVGMTRGYAGFGVDVSPLAAFVAVWLASLAFFAANVGLCLLYTSPSPRDKRQSRMPSSA